MKIWEINLKEGKQYKSIGDSNNDWFKRGCSK